MMKENTAEKVVKDFTTANEERKEYSFEYNGKKLCGGWFNEHDAIMFAQGMAIGFRKFRKTAKIEVYTLNPKRLERVQE